MKLIAGKEIEAVVFDKDGTIIDLPSIWLPWFYDIYDYLKNNIKKPIFSLATLKTAFGVSDQAIDPNGPLAIAGIKESEVITTYLLYEAGLGWSEALTHARESMLYANKKQNNSTEIEAIAGIEACLIELRKRNIKLGVLTADDTDKAEKQLTQLDLAKYFDFIIGSDLVENGKPDPEMAYLARDAYQLDLAKTIMIGDTDADMRLGRSAGFQEVIGVVTYSKDKTAHLDDADYLIRSYTELL